MAISRRNVTKSVATVFLVGYSAWGCSDHSSHHHIPPEVEHAAAQDDVQLQLFSQALTGEFPGSQFISSPNYTKAWRNKGQVKVIVVHTIQGSYNGCISWFKNPKAKVSAHYVISKSGAVTQMVKEKDIGWHVGSQNGYTIGLEHEGFVHDPKWVTTAMLDKSAKLTCYLTKKWGLPINRTTIKGHVELPKQTHTDPGIFWPWDDYIARVKKHCGQDGGITGPSDCSQCDDKNPCTKDGCKDGKCAHTDLNGAVCWDGNPCTAGEKCNSGKCTGGKLIVKCDDGNPCTQDACNSKTGSCYHTATTGPCQDANPCTLGDHCAQGQCKWATWKNCADGNACTLDACDKATGACNSNKSADGSACDDGSPCTKGDACSNGACVGVVISCDDTNPCTNDICGAKGCAHIPNTMHCDDANPCTLNDQCAAGSCIGESMDCSSHNSGCTAGYCSKGKCVGGGSNCDDHDTCTTDTCVAGQCQHSQHNGLCDDGDACTAGDSCAAGVCAGTAVDCGDDEVCTTDRCEAGKCVHAVVADCRDSPAGDATSSSDQGRNDAGSSEPSARTTTTAADAQSQGADSSAGSLFGAPAPRPTTGGCSATVCNHSDSSPLLLLTLSLPALLFSRRRKESVTC